eukprot:s241_g12.t1
MVRMVTIPPDKKGEPVRRSGDESDESDYEYEYESYSNSNSPHDGGERKEEREKDNDAKKDPAPKEDDDNARELASSPSLGRRDDGFRERKRIQKSTDKKDRDDGSRRHRKDDASSKHTSSHGHVNRNKQQEKEKEKEPKSKEEDLDRSKASQKPAKPSVDWVRCKVCNKAVKGPAGLEMHMLSSSRCGAARGESTRVACPLCKKMISKGEWPMEQHLNNGCPVAEKQRQKNVNTKQPAVGARLKSRSRSPLKRKVVAADGGTDDAAPVRPTPVDGSKPPPVPLEPPRHKSNDLALTPWRRQMPRREVIQVHTQNRPGFDSEEWPEGFAGDSGGSGGSFSFRPTNLRASSSASSSNSNAPLVAFFHGLAGLLDR